MNFLQQLLSVVTIAFVLIHPAYAQKYTEAYTRTENAFGCDELGQFTLGDDGSMWAICRTLRNEIFGPVLERKKLVTWNMNGESLIVDVPDKDTSLGNHFDDTVEAIGVGTEGLLVLTNTALYTIPSGSLNFVKIFDNPLTPYAGLYQVFNGGVVTLDIIANSEVFAQNFGLAPNQGKLTYVKQGKVFLLPQGLPDKTNTATLGVLQDGRLVFRATSSVRRPLVCDAVTCVKCASKTNGSFPVYVASQVNSIVGSMFIGGQHVGGFWNVQGNKCNFKKFITSNVQTSTKNIDVLPAAVSQRGATLAYVYSRRKLLDRVLWRELKGKSVSFSKYYKKMSGRKSTQIWEVMNNRNQLLIVMNDNNSSAYRIGLLSSDVNS